MIEGLSTLEIVGVALTIVGVPVGFGKGIALINQSIALGKASHRRQDAFEKEVREDMMKAAEERGRRAADNEAVHRDLRDLKEAFGKGFATLRDEMTGRFGRIDERLDRR